MGRRRNDCGKGFGDIREAAVKSCVISSKLHLTSASGFAHLVNGDRDNDEEKDDGPADVAVGGHQSIWT